MIFSRLEVFAYLVGMSLVAWFLYPSEYARGMMLRQDGDRSESIAFFSDYLARNPYHKGANLALATAYEDAGRPGRAVEPLLRFYRHRRGDAETGEKVLGLLARGGYPARADAFRWEFIEDLKKKPVPPIEVIERMLYEAFQKAAIRQDDEETFRALGELARLSSSQGDGYRDQMLRILMARRQINRALKLLKAESRERPESMALRKTIVRIHMLEKNFDKALEELDAAIMIASRDASVIWIRASLFVELKQWDRALDDFRRLETVEPTKEDWIREQAYCLLKLQKVEEAVELYDRLITLRPDDKERWWNVIYAYSDNKLHVQAAARLEAYVRRFPKDPKGIESLVYEYKLSGYLERAISALKSRVKFLPGDFDSRSTLVELLRSEERYEETVEHYEALIRLRPKNRELRPEFAFVHARRGDTAAAAAAFEEHLAIFPDDKNAMDKLVSLLSNLGQKEKAIRLLQEYFEKNQIRAAAQKSGAAP